MGKSLTKKIFGLLIKDFYFILDYKVSFGNIPSILRRKNLLFKFKPYL